MSDYDQLAYKLRKALTPHILAATPIYLPFIPERVIPIPLASSGGVHGYFAQPWPIAVLAFYATVNVLTTNNSTNYWTIQLQDSPANVLASVSTQTGVTPGAAFRLLDTTVTAPVAASPFLQVVPIATGAPGALYLVPAVAVLIG